VQLIHHNPSPAFRISTVPRVRLGVDSLVRVVEGRYGIGGREGIFYSRKGYIVLRLGCRECLYRMGKMIRGLGCLVAWLAYR